MIITINGMPGSGKSTVADYLARKFHLKHYSAGGIRREMALKKGLTIAQLNKVGEKEAWTDKEVDEFQIKLGRERDNFIIDGRLSWHFIPDSIKIYFIVDLKEGARRILLSKREEESYKNPGDALKKLKERIESDKKRYKKYYNLNPYTIGNYDIVIDTTNLSVEQMRKITEKAIKNLIGKK